MIGCTLLVEQQSLKSGLHNIYFRKTLCLKKRGYIGFRKRADVAHDATKTFLQQSEG